MVVFEDIVCYKHNQVCNRAPNLNYSECLSGAQLRAGADLTIKILILYFSHR